MSDENIGVKSCLTPDQRRMEQKGCPNKRASIINENMLENQRKPLRSIERLRKKLEQKKLMLK